jgi:hypothetical protein
MVMNPEPKKYGRTEIGHILMLASAVCDFLDPHGQPGAGKTDRAVDSLSDAAIYVDNSTTSSIPPETNGTN